MQCSTSFAATPSSTHFSWCSAVPHLWQTALLSLLGGNHALELGRIPLTRSMLNASLKSSPLLETSWLLQRSCRPVPRRCCNPPVPWKRQGELGSPPGAAGLCAPRSPGSEPGHGARLGMRPAPPAELRDTEGLRCPACPATPAEHRQGLQRLLSSSRAQSETENKHLQQQGCDLTGLQAKSSQALTLAKSLRVG